MGVRFACHACGKRLHIKTELAGKRGICPDCQARFRIPHEDADVSSPLDKDAAIPDQTSEPLSKAENERVAPPAAKPRASLLDSEPEAAWYVRPPSGGQYGPASSPLLRQWVEEQRVAASALLWREGWPQWRIASEALPEFSDQLPGTEGSAAPEPAVTPVEAAVAPSDASPVAGERSAASVEESVSEAEARLRGRWDVGATRRGRMTRRMVAVGILLAVSVVLVAVLLLLTLRPLMTSAAF